METRDELLNGLNEAVSIIRQLANIQINLNTVRSQYRNTIPNKKMGKLAKTVLVLLALCCVMFNWGILIGFKNTFSDKCIKYSQLYSKCAIVSMLGIKVGKKDDDL